MHPSTPSGDPGTDTPDDPTGKYGDVDINGDLVDELDARLTRCIVGASAGIERDQLRAVRVMLGRTGATS